MSNYSKEQIESIINNLESKPIEFKNVKLSDKRETGTDLYFICDRNIEIRYKKGVGTIFIKEIGSDYWKHIKEFIIREYN